MLENFKSTWETATALSKKGGHGFHDECLASYEKVMNFGASNLTQGFMLLKELPKNTRKYPFWYSEPTTYSLFPSNASMHLSSLSFVSTPLFYNHKHSTLFSMLYILRVVFLVFQYSLFTLQSYIISGMLLIKCSCI